MPKKPKCNPSYFEQCVQQLLERFPEPVTFEPPAGLAPTSLLVYLRRWLRQCTTHRPEFLTEDQYRKLLEIRPQVRLIVQGTTVWAGLRGSAPTSAPRTLELTVPNEACWRALACLAAHRVLPCAVQAWARDSVPPPADMVNNPEQDFLLVREDEYWLLL